MSALKPMLDSSQGGVPPSWIEQGHACRLLLIEDACPMRQALSDALCAKGYGVACAANETEALEELTKWQPQVVLLDLSVHQGEGLSVCRRVHDEANVPIILIAPPDSEAKVLLGLEIGASDYLVRPLDLEALTNRITVVTTRVAQPGLPVSEQLLTAGPLTIHTARRTIDVRGEEVHFARREYDLLLALVLRAGRIRTRNELVDECWGHRLSDSKTIDTHIRRIRQKVELDEHKPRHVITVRGIGFYFDPGKS